MSQSFHLLAAGSDIKCPYCKYAFDVEWDTDYGIPVMGDHAVTCIECDRLINFHVETVYTVKAPMKVIDDIDDD